MASFKHDWEVYLDAKGFADESPFWRKIVDGCCFEHTIVQDTFSLIAQPGVNIDDVKKQVRRITCHFGSSLPIEREFQKLQDHSDRDSSKNVISALSLWYKAVQEHILI